MKRRSFLKILGGSSLAIALPTGVVVNSIIDNNLRLPYIDPVGNIKYFTVVRNAYNKFNPIKQRVIDIAKTRVEYKRSKNKMVDIHSYYLANLAHKGDKVIPLHIVKMMHSTDCKIMNLEEVEDVRNKGTVRLNRVSSNII